MKKSRRNSQNKKNIKRDKKYGSTRDNKIIKIEAEKILIAETIVEIIMSYKTVEN